MLIRTELKRLELSSSLSELRKLTEFVDHFCQTANAAHADRIALQVILEEIATNVIVHGYQNAPDHVLIVTLRADHMALIATVVDDAPPYDPLARPELDTSIPGELRPIGGIGIHFVKKLGHPSYERRGNQNVLTVMRPVLSSTP